MRAFPQALLSNPMSDSLGLWAQALLYALGVFGQ